MARRSVIAFVLIGSIVVLGAGVYLYKRVFIDGALYNAVGSNDNDKAKRLLMFGADPNEVTDNGSERPLHAAARFPNIKGVRILLEHGADPCQSNENGQLPVDVTSDQTIKDVLNRSMLKHNCK